MLAVVLRVTCGAREDNITQNDAVFAQVSAVANAAPNFRRSCLFRPYPQLNGDQWYRRAPFIYFDKCLLYFTPSIALELLLLLLLTALRLLPQTHGWNASGTKRFVSFFLDSGKRSPLQIASKLQRQWQRGHGRTGMVSG